MADAPIGQTEPGNTPTAVVAEKPKRGRKPKPKVGAVERLSAYSALKPIIRPPEIPTITAYGLSYPKGAFRYAIELDCYRRGHTKELGGLGPEEHFKNAWKIFWPEFAWNDWCELMVWAWCRYKYIRVIGHQRGGKCLGKGTPVLMYDGSIKSVEEILEGDLLMGDDSSPRRVLSITRGREELFKVRSSRGAEWVCNRSHILSFKASRNYHPARDGIKYQFRKGDFRDVPLTEFIGKARYWRDTWKQYQVGVEFPKRDWTPPFDPRIVGMWIADGGFDTPSFCKPKGALTEYWCDYWTKRGARIKIEDEDRCPMFFVRFDRMGRSEGNPFTRFIRTLTNTGEKRIPREYLTASKRDRASLLAGLLDGDGHCSRNKVTVTTKYPGLAKDICFLARSLGFYTSDDYRKGVIKNLGFVGDYRSVYIAGDWSGVPFMRLKPSNVQSSDPTCQSITLESLGEGDYYGFEIDGNHRFLLGDFTVTHNTYNFAHVGYLDYCCDPLNTLTSLATVTFEGLRLRMWSDLLRAIETSRVPNIFTVRSTTNECRVFPTEKAREAGEKYQIQGMSVSRTQDAPGRIRGGHADRRIIMLDEAQDMPDAIDEAMANPMSAPFARDVRLSNPIEKVSRFGDACEPVDGWGSVDENDLWWETKRGNGQGVCLHLDGLQSPNIKAGKTIFPYLLTQDSVTEVISNHGKDSVQYWALVRGFFPPDGVVAKIWPASTIERAKPSINFDFQPQVCATLDAAFENDDCVMHFGNLGMPVFGTRDYKISGTETLVCKIDAGPGAEPKDYQVAYWVIAECKRRGVQPKHFIMDTTGNARGVFAILQKEWSREVQGVEYGGAATDRMLRGDDSRKCDVMYQWFVTELWFRASEYARAGLLGGLSNLNTKTIDDLSSRRYELKQGTKGALLVAESKKIIKGRLGRSPDFGDPFCQFGELLIRLGTMPGGGAANRLAIQQKVGTAWSKHKERAQRVNGIYNEAREHSYF